jgi:hypothetical protein
MKYYFLLILCFLFLCSCIKPIDRHPDAKKLFEEIRIMSQQPAMPEDVEAMEAKLAAIKYHGLKDSVEVARQLLMNMDVFVETGSVMIDPTTGEKYSDHTEMSTYNYGIYKKNKQEITGYLNEIHQEKDLDVDRVAFLLNRYHWDLEICKMIAKHQVQVGFNKAQVSEALGAPGDIAEKEKGNSVYADWVYPDVIIHFVNNELASFSINNGSSTQGDIYSRPGPEIKN